jgi:hypothetical protein
MQTLEERRRLESWKVVTCRVRHRRRKIEDNHVPHVPRPLPRWFGIVHDHRDVMAVLVVGCIGLVLWMIWK